jgi:hypothetical protein
LIYLKVFNLRIDGCIFVGCHHILFILGCAA